MEASVFQIHSRNLYMNSFPFKVKSIFSFNSGSNFSPFCTYSLSLIPANILIKTLKLPEKGGRRVVRKAVKAPDTAALKEGWLDSLSCPIAGRARLEEDSAEVNAGPNWVIGIDPDISGALALLKTDDSGCTAQVFDVPHLTVPVGKRLRKRLDARSMVEIVRSLEAPWGSTAYIEQSLPFPQDGKQGWWSGGFGYGLWIGILVASGFTVVPVPSLLWKNEFGIAGDGFSKDDSRRIASTLFPLLGDQLKRKKDHGRADALLIAAYGNGTKLKPSVEELAP